MGKGEGNQTTMLGGGNGGSWIVAKRLIDSVDQTKDGAKLVNTPDAPGSNGYSRWLARNIFAHTERGATPGVFVEFGARDGVHQSNTLTYEKIWGWSGILVEAGRDYIAGLRAQRNCRVLNQTGACVWAALDAEAGAVRYWSADMVGAARPYGKRLQRSTDKYVVTATDRAVTTIELQALLDSFGVRRVDYMSCDCEGCETHALASVDFARTRVDVLTVESPSCVLARRLVDAGYVVLPLWFHHDAAFVHARIAREIPAPHLWLDSEQNEHPEVMRAKGHKRAAEHIETLVHSEKCASVPGVHPLADAVWNQGDTWPPAFAETYRSQAPER